MQIARNKNGELVIGERLRRKKRYARKQEEVYTPYGDKEVMVDDLSKPLDPIEWEGVYDVVSDESVFTERIKILTWADEPITI